MDDEESETAEVRMTDLLDVDGNVRVHARRCGSCIYWDENRMMLAPGRREQMEADADATDSFIPCHQTLPCSPYEAPPAICHGYWVHAKDSNWRLRYARMTESVARVEPPCITWNHPERTDSD